MTIAIAAATPIPLHCDAHGPLLPRRYVAIAWVSASRAYVCVRASLMKRDTHFFKPFYKQLIFYIMKARFLVLAAMMLGLASCQTEPEGLNVNVGGEVDTVVTVTIPETETRYGNESNSAKSVFDNGILDDENTTMRYILEIYYGDVRAERQVKYSDRIETITFPVRLVAGRDYNFVVWADVVTKNAGEEFSDSDNHYNTTTENKWLRNVTLNDTWVAMDESRDAFTGYYNTLKEGTKYTGNLSINITLTRPFAKLRVITTDVADLEKLGLEAKTAKVVYTTPYRSAFNAATGTAYAANENDKKTHDTFEIASYADSKDGKQVLFTDYFFATDEIVKFDLAVYDEDGQVFGSENFLSFNTDIPVKRNYLTTIQGNILTEGGNVTVKVEDAFTQPENIVEYVEVNNPTEFQNAIENAEDGEETVIVLGDNINLNDLISTLSTRAASTALTIANGKTISIDLNGKTLSATSTQSGGNQELFLVKGNLSIVNGNIEYKHEGENMGWGAMTTIFDVTAGGVLNLEGVTAKNLGGSDMAFVAHLNNWGEATLNVKNSTLESTYIAVRAFNSGYDMNNISIYNSTLKGKYCFWVHNFKAAGDAAGTSETLNVDIYNGTNTFKYTGTAPVLYGFNEPLYFDENGYGVLENGNVNIVAAAGLKKLANEVNNGTAFSGKTVTLHSNIDLKGEAWTPIGTSSNIFKGTFDGQNHTIKNLVVNGGSTGNQGLFGVTHNGEIENLVVENAKVSGRTNVGVVAGNPYTSKYTNITVQGHIEVNGLAYVGGVGGKDAYANWTNITVDADNTSYVKAVSIENGKAYRTYVGGVVGFNGEGNHKFSNITSNINVEGSTCDVGGLFGIAHYGNQFENCVCTGNVTITTDEAENAIEMGGIAGVWHNEAGQTVTMTNCTFNGELFAPNVNEEFEFYYNGLVGAPYSATGTGKLIVDGKVISFTTIDNTADLQKALAEGQLVKLANDLTITAEQMTTAPYGNKMALSQNGGIFDGNGKNISVTAGGDNYVVMTNGGTIKNLDIDRGFRGILLMSPNQDVYVDNVKIGVDDEVCYTINTAEGANGKHNLYVSNSTLNGWCSIGDACVKFVSFTNCTFGQGTYYTDVFGRLVKPYVDAVFDGCDFCDMCYIDLSAFVGTKVVIKNCTVNGVKITAENWTSLVAPEDTCGDGQISVELKNGTYLTAENVVDYIVFE